LGGNFKKNSTMSIMKYLTLDPQVSIQATRSALRTRTAPDAAASRCCIKASGARSVMTHGATRMPPLYADSWDESFPLQAAQLHTEKVLATFGWTTLSALARRHAWRAARAAHGGGTTVIIAKMRELAVRVRSVRVSVRIYGMA
jgi:hypothetical protein